MRRPPPDAGSGRPLLEKLGVRRGTRAAIVGFSDPAFAAALAEAGAVVEPPPAELDLVFFYVREPSELARLGELRRHVHDAGAIWVLRDKGAGRTVSETDIIHAGRAFELVDNKIASFSHTLAAMRLVVPLNHRRT